MAAFELDYRGLFGGYRVHLGDVPMWTVTYRTEPQPPETPDDGDEIRDDDTDPIPEPEEE